MLLLLGIEVRLSDIAPVWGAGTALLAGGRGGGGAAVVVGGGRRVEGEGLVVLFVRGKGALRVLFFGGSGAPGMEAMVGFFWGGARTEVCELWDEGGGGGAGFCGGSSD